MTQKIKLVPAKTLYRKLNKKAKRKRSRRCVCCGSRGRIRCTGLTVRLKCRCKLGQVYHGTYDLK